MLLLLGGEPCKKVCIGYRRLGGDGRQMTESEDWPSVPESSAENWSDSIRVLKQLNDDLRQAVRSFPGERLDQPLVPEAPYTAYTQFIGVTQHNLYHAGQMALLKKALRSDRVLKSHQGGGAT